MFHPVGDNSRHSNGWPREEASESYRLGNVVRAIRGEMRVTACLRVAAVI